MKRVFVFCIGGTGIRVMKSITMLLAAGMDSNGFNVVPVIVDPHEDLSERGILQTLLQEYRAVYSYINDNCPESQLKGFFGTNIEDLNRINGQQNDTSTSISENRPFGQFLNVGNLASDDINQYLVQTMFSQANLNNELSVGFKGSPNVGTVVLGEVIKGANWFKAFCSSCGKEDRIFIISSIFGGTGASGFPMLEKKIREPQGNQIVKDAMMGAITVLPYFKLEDPSTTDSDIDSSNFLTKTKAALSYYENNILSDYLYYIGEQNMNRVTYPNDERKQEDPANFIELVAATALFDFLKKTDKPEKTPQAYSRGIKKDEEKMNIDNLGDDYADIVKAVADMSLLSRLVFFLPNEQHFPLSKTRGFNDRLYYNTEFKKLENFLQLWDNWYKELEENQRAFTPLTIANKNNRRVNLQNWITHRTLDAKNESYYLLEMLQLSKKDKDKSKDFKFRRFIDYAYRAIDKYTSKIINK